MICMSFCGCSRGLGGDGARVGESSDAAQAASTRSVSSRGGVVDYGGDRVSLGAACTSAGCAGAGLEAHWAGQPGSRRGVGRKCRAGRWERRHAADLDEQGTAVRTGAGARPVRDMQPDAAVARGTDESEPVRTKSRTPATIGAPDSVAARAADYSLQIPNHCLM